MCASRCRERCGRKARVECTTPQKLMLISQSICAWSISLNWPSSATPALLTTMLSAGMGRDRGLREGRDLRGLADIDAVHRDLACDLRLRLGDLGGDRLQAGLVAIGEREIAAARGEFQRQRPADAAGGSGHGGSGSTDRGHRRSLQPEEVVGGKPYTAWSARATGAGRAASARTVAA